MRRLFALLLIACVLPAMAYAADVGEKAALSGALLSGEDFDIAALKGHVVIVNVWATWCTPCRAEMPILDRFAAAHRAQGVVLIGLSEDKPRDEALVRDAAARVRYPIAMIPALRANRFGRPHILPVTYIVGPDGIIHTVLRPDAGAVSEGQLWQAVAPLLTDR